jgi:hypothetical protein
VSQHPFEGRGGGLSQPVGPAPRKQTHRELMYDPQCGGRRFKHFMRLTTAAARAEEAWCMGQAAAMGNVGGRWLTNPYRPGRRHDLYEQGRAAVLRDQDERRTERRWGA